MTEIKPVYQTSIDNDSFFSKLNFTSMDVSDRDRWIKSGHKVNTLYPAAAYEALQKENSELKESNLELERLCDTTYVKQGADAYNDCCEVFEAWWVKRQKLDLPTHDWADGLYNSLNWLQDTVEELETESAAQAKRIDNIKPFLLDCASSDFVCTSQTLCDKANELLDMLIGE